MRVRDRLTELRDAIHLAAASSGARDIRVFLDQSLAARKTPRATSIFWLA
jgi:hypothetical protein